MASGQRHAALDQRVVMEGGPDAGRLGDEQERPRPATSAGTASDRRPRSADDRVEADDRAGRRVRSNTAIGLDSLHEVEAAAERSCRRHPDVPAREQVVERVPQVVARDPLRQPRVVEAALVAEAPVAVEDEHVERAGRAVGLRDPLAVVDQVRER